MIACEPMSRIGRSSCAGRISCGGRIGGGSPREIRCEGALNDWMERSWLCVLSGQRDWSRLAAVVDTGVSGFLTIPDDVAADLSLRFNGMARVVLADDSEVYAAEVHSTVLRDGVPRTTSPTLRRAPLIGVGMLVDHSLHINFEPAGDVLAVPSRSRASCGFPVARMFPDLYVLTRHEALATVRVVCATGIQPAAGTSPAAAPQSVRHPRRRAGPP